MGVIFQNGMAVGAVPGYSNFGIPRSWLLGTDSFGCQPAWDNGVMVLIPWFIGGCFGSADLFGVIGNGSANFGFYMSGIDSTGTDQSTFLSQVIGQTGTMTFTQGTSSITIGFDETTFHANTYSSTDGIYYENNNGVTAPFIVSGSGIFYGFNNAGQGTNSSGGSGEQYFVNPSNSQLLTLDINIGPIVTPTPTATATPTPTATDTPMPTPTSTPAFYQYGGYFESEYSIQSEACAQPLVNGVTLYGSTPTFLVGYKLYRLSNFTNPYITVAPGYYIKVTDAYNDEYILTTDIDGFITELILCSSITPTPTPTA